MDVRRKPIPQIYTPQPQPISVPMYQQHSRTRTTSSSAFPTEVYSPPYAQNNNMTMPTNYTSRRTPSTNTFSTTNSGNGPFPSRQQSNSQNDLRRSTSSRSGGTTAPSSYVALMRKQKATVWCDRAQHEDPRLLAAQRAAKKRATMEVTGGLNASGRTSTGGSGSLAGGNRVTAKIRHHGKAGLVGYSPGDLVGGVGGVPMRLSASEVEGGDSDDDADSTGHSGYALYHQRTGSGRSSVGSGGRRGLTYSRQSGASSSAGRYSAGHTPPDHEPRIEDNAETPLASKQQNGPNNYFASEGDGTAGSMGSGSSGERADGVAELSASKLASNNLLRSQTGTVKSLRHGGYGDLARRGSVDDRTMTMSAGRLYIANPDEDSD
ncbi:hypothetical protein BP6252_02346 [Coleophoma cylindrospora]|uniref:Uncharacterized protein n=1 Tax=Coleophoma cylindrospora TaxID=1849047 RepID=A0A3D8SEN7_9HELO|nr:hypothetical protein BP6252_02346 [Coleophoma cylindrospora]